MRNIKTISELIESKQTAKYWELEEPETLRTDKNTFRYYPNAGRLTVHLADYFDEKHDMWKMAKGVSVNLNVLKQHPEIARRLVGILTALIDN